MARCPRAGRRGATSDRDRAAGAALRLRRRRPGHLRRVVRDHPARGRSSTGCRPTRRRSPYGWSTAAGRSTWCPTSSSTPGWCRAARDRADGRGADILCDAQMVAMGITAGRLPARQRGASASCATSGCPALAQEWRTTRTAAAVSLWEPHLEGAVVAIGNAPTALFHLLEMLIAGAPRPAAIIGCPVGLHRRRRVEGRPRRPRRRPRHRRTVRHRARVAAAARRWHRRPSTRWPRRRNDRPDASTASASARATPS